MVVRARRESKRTRGKAGGDFCQVSPMHDTPRVAELQATDHLEQVRLEYTRLPVGGRAAPTQVHFVRHRGGIGQEVYTVAGQRASKQKSDVHSTPIRESHKYFAATYTHIHA